MLPDRETAVIERQSTLDSISRTPLESVGRRRFLIGAWPWRSLAYLLTTAPLVAAVGLPSLVLGFPWLIALRRVTTGEFQPLGTLLMTVLVGAVLVAAFGPLVAMPVAAVERRRLRLVDTGPPVVVHHPPIAPGPWPWLRHRYAEATTWRAVGYTFLLVTAVPVLYGAVLAVPVLIVTLVASPFLVGQDVGPVSLGFDTVDSVGDALRYAVAGLLLLPSVPYLLAVLAGAHGAVARLLLHDGGGGTGEQLRAELVEVARSRARLVDAFDSERRRIERDLHDGAQQRLVSLTLQLGLARLDLPADSPAAGTLATAHEQAKQAMVELREIVHGIHPQILTERGLPAALSELADRCSIPVTVRCEPSGRLPGQLEAAVYFVVAEALTNAARHSGATEVSVTVEQRAGRVVVQVGDDGRGGADPNRGTGLTGLADRVAVVGGRMLLSSPAGGPTLLRVELPCPR
ncbi:sensor histidine kinase [Micromonospora sp. NBC_01796]|uniref:sensor histidine kinase n=1 Tax=Micromonospora sp. NBC_01796 TaxID=2975987 RepID=UPI002DD7E685|nr:sensor histidine kinase [Micromonospora sp. NBC_01796]WSA89518.1 sensor histidine kinase [Micromonospora sp. NBC_01796]